MKILLVDDEPFVRAIVGKMLATAGHSVEMACDGPQALDALRQGAFQVVITDLQMPGMDGLMLARLIKAKLPSQTIVLLTGAGCAGAQPPNIDCVLDKPVRWQAMASFLDSLAAGPSCPARSAVLSGVTNS